MQRNGSLTSLSTQSCHIDPVRDTSTDALLATDNRFLKKSRKLDPQAPGGLYYFPNGEVFRPRSTPARRNRPAKVAEIVPSENSTFDPRQEPISGIPRSYIPRAGSLTLLSSAMSLPVGGYMTKSPSFNNLKCRNKQDLVNSIRKTKIDTPTNINISGFGATTTPLVQPRLHSLMNNRYCENSTNIVKLEQVLYIPTSETVSHSRNGTSSDSNPSSLSNYNLNRSNSNTPQTSVNTSLENGIDTTSEADSPSSPLPKCSSLDLIEESDISLPAFADSSRNLETVGLQSSQPSTDAQVLENSHSDDSYESADEHTDRGGENSGHANNDNDNNSIHTHSSSSKSSRKSLSTEKGSEVGESSVNSNDEHEKLDVASDLPAKAYVHHSAMSLASELPEPTICLSEPLRNSGCSESTFVGPPGRLAFPGPLYFDSDMGSAPPSPISKDSPRSGQKSTAPPTPIEKDSPRARNLIDKVGLQEIVMSDDKQKLVDPPPKSGTVIERASPQIRQKIASMIPALIPQQPRKSQPIPLSASKSFARRNEVLKSASPTEKETLIRRKLSSLIPGKAEAPNSSNASAPSLPVSRLNSMVSLARKLSQSLRASPKNTTSSSPAHTPTRPKAVRSMLVDDSPTPIGNMASKDPVAKEVATEVPSTEVPVKEVPKEIEQQNPRTVVSEFLTRRKAGLLLEIIPMDSEKEFLSDAPTPISKNSSKKDFAWKEVVQPRPTPAKSPALILREEALFTSPTRAERTQSPMSEFSFATGEDQLSSKDRQHQNGAETPPEEKTVTAKHFYPPEQIKRLLSDKQSEVPPRGDLSINGDSIKLHDRPLSCGSFSSVLPNGGPFSVNSSVKKEFLDLPIAASQTGELGLPIPVPFSAPATESYSKSLTDAVIGVGYKEMVSQSNEPYTSPLLKPGLQLINRLSMFDVVNVDFDKTLPPSPKKIEKSSSKSLLGGLSSSAITASPEKLSPPVSPSARKHNMKKASSMSNFRKMFRKFGSSDIKEQVSATTSGSPKRSGTALIKPLVSAPNHKEKSFGKKNETSVSKNLTANNSQVFEDAPPKPTFKTSPLLKKNRRKNFFSNLKLASASRVEELPHPVYNVRERPLTPEVQAFPKAQYEHFDLPQFEADEDAFQDIFLKFDEVEKKVELEVEQSRTQKPKANDFFLKDVELTRAQIVDQQRKDNQISDESLPIRFGGSDTDLPASYVDEIIPYMQNELEWPAENDVPERKSVDIIVELKDDNGDLRVVLNSRQLQSVFADLTQKFFPTYLTHIKQFKDFELIEILIEAFDPFSRGVIAEPQARVHPILKNPDIEKQAPRKGVKFSNTISISETFPGHMYKRYNKSVTQYYLTESGEVNKIKNELNAYKCHEMLVHEKSQNNTHFFY